MSTFESEQPLVPEPTVSSPPARPPRHIGHIFVGPLGLRAGWGILLFLVLAALLATGLVIGTTKATGRAKQMRVEAKQMREAAKQAKAAHLPPSPQPMRLSFSLIQEAPAFVAVLLAGWALSRIERRRFGVYGLRLRHLRDVLPGALWGFAAMALLVGALRGLHLLVFDRLLLHGAAMARFGLLWLLLFLLVGVYEEFLFRGYIQFTQTRGFLGLAQRISPSNTRNLAFWMGAVIWSTVFFVAHLSNSGENPSGLIGVFLAGILFSYALWRTGSLWWGIGFHMTWDWSQSFLYGVPDSGTLSIGRLFQTHPVGNPLLSGGVDGPEGSLLLLPVLLLMFLVLRLHPQAEQPPLEPAVSPPLLSPLQEPIA